MIIEDIDIERVSDLRIVRDFVQLREKTAIRFEEILKQGAVRKAKLDTFQPFLALLRLINDDDRRELQITMQTLLIAFTVVRVVPKQLTIVSLLHSCILKIETVTVDARKDGDENHDRLGKMNSDQEYHQAN
jgi:hypothetical protein